MKAFRGTRRRLSWFLVAVQIASVLVTVGATPASADVPPSEWVLGPRKDVVFITFEGRPQVSGLQQVVSTLDVKNATASFFLPGWWVSRHRDAARAIPRGGHAMGNRGWRSSDFTRLDDAAIRRSLGRARDALARIGVYPRPFMRAPGGARDLRVLRAAGRSGYRSVRWTYEGGRGTARRVGRRVVRKARYGSIIALDIWRESHRDALPRIIDGLRRRGFRLGTIEKLTNAYPIRWDVTVRSGSSGPQVTFLQRRLNATTYHAGAADGAFGYKTLQATYAYEKVHNLVRDGVVPPRQLTAIAVGRRPHAPKRDPGTFIDIDISRQVLFEVKRRRVVHTIPISSGNEEYYTVDGQTYRAHTPRGKFTIQRKIYGRRVSRLGTLWYPTYFYGGYAIHGSSSVPTYPASHGCVRIPMYLARPFYNRTPVGKPVFVHD